MLNYKDRSQCAGGEAIAAYIYDELEFVERGVLEEHLMGCDICTGELAYLSEARYSIFEWKSVEFNELATPVVVLPLEPEVAVVRPGILEQLRGIFTTAWIPAGVTAILLLAFGVWIFRGNSQEFPAPAAQSQALSVPVSDPPPAKDVTVTAEPAKGDSTSPPAVKAEGAKMVTRVQETRPAKRYERPAAVPSQQLTARVPVRASRVGTATDAPTLSGYSDSADGSLRLTDLFDDEGGSK